MEEIIQDLVVVGAGPAGLSAAINGASELQRVVLLDSGKKVAEGQYIEQLGGQAVDSARIENYAGFPGGISGRELISRFEEQARTLGADVYCPEHAANLTLDPDTGLKRVTTREGSVFLTRSVILANGLSYRKLKAEGIAELLNKGVKYGAPTCNPQELGKCIACVVGGANSAGQAIMHLSQNPDMRIFVLVRGTRGIEYQMSKYLVDRIHACTNVEIVQDISVTTAYGTEKLEGIKVKSGDGSVRSMKTDHLFIFIGAEPKTEWLQGAVQMDSRRFIATGNDLGTLFGKRAPFETSVPGVFAVGDIRYGSVKRVAAAVGEGSAGVSMLHRYLSANGT